MPRLILEDIKKPENIEIFYKPKNYPIFLFAPQKSGCTFVKNLVYYLENGEANPLGDRIHDEEETLSRGKLEDMDQMLNSPYVIMIVRNPVRRFLSLYFDKIYNPSARDFRWFRKEIGEDIGMNFERDLPLEDHQNNARILIDWFAKNLNHETAQPTNLHWTLQFWRWLQLRSFEPVLLPLEEIDNVLPIFLRNEITNIEDVMNRVKSRNVSQKLYTEEEMRNWPMTKRIREVYSDDFRLHNKAKKNATRILEGEWLISG